MATLLIQRYLPASPSNAEEDEVHTRVACTANWGAAAMAAVALGASAGCGGDGGGGEASKPAATTTRPQAKPTSSVGLVALPTSGFKFDKNRLTARPGTIEIRLVNHDDIPHNVRIQRGTDCCFKRGSRDIGGTKTISPGDTPITGTAPVTAGTYSFYCSIAGHWQNGMRGTLVVK